MAFTLCVNPNKNKNVEKSVTKLIIFNCSISKRVLLIYDTNKAGITLSLLSI